MPEPDKALRWTVIANPCAGGFTIKRRWTKHCADLVSAACSAAANPLRTDAAPSRVAGNTGVIATECAGHAARITRDLLAEMETDDAFHLIIMASGDGTSLEVMTTLFHADETLRSRCAVLRLPMGTGNDGADAWELSSALDLLIKSTKIVRVRAVSLTTCVNDAETAKKSPFLAFNILSVGLDAFVTHHTNRMKGKMPGDSYKLWVDIAALFYDKIYRIGDMSMKVFEAESSDPHTLVVKTLLIAMGASGYRTYGSHKRILPDERNVCIVRQMPLLRKFALKDQFTTGTHVNKPETMFFSADRVEFSGQNPILAQMDGETVLLQPSDFPCAISLTEPVIPILRLVQDNQNLKLL